MTVRGQAVILKFNFSKSCDHKKSFLFECSPCSAAVILKFNFSKSCDHKKSFLPACTYVQRGSKFCFVVVVLVVVVGDTLIKLQWPVTGYQTAVAGYQTAVAGYQTAVTGYKTAVQWQDTKLQ
jgi:hypothetical protein